MRLITAIALLCALFAAPAEARTHRVAAPPPCEGLFCGFFNPQPAPAAQKRVRVKRREHHPKLLKHIDKPRFGAVESITPQSTVVEHPEGCPRTAFCGCGAALRVFGHQVRRLWLAANWFSFPRAEPAPGMVAVRRHHVFVLEAQLDRGLWLVYDANSGRHLTRIHPHTLVGYTIVNPHPS